MVEKQTVRWFVPLLLCLLSGAVSCKGKHSAPVSGNVYVADIDLPEIRDRGKLIASTEYNSINYFIYRGEPMGFQYEMLRDLSDHLNIRLELVVENDLEASFNALNRGNCDLIANNLSITRERGKKVDFTSPIGQTRQVLVQRKPKNWRSMHPSELDRELIRNQLELAGKTVHVQQNAAFVSRLRNLAEEIGDSIDIREVPQEAEELISLVASGEIDYTVSDENVALVNQTYHPEIDVATAISFPQNLAWAVRKTSHELKKEIDEWLKSYRSSLSYALIYNKYFRNQRSADIIRSDFFTLSSGKISPYDEAIRRYSEMIDWDWRLVASLIYQESRFDPHVESWAGAFGLMQLMPSTAARYGVVHQSPPEKNIEAGIKFIRWLDNIFADKVEDPQERIKFVLAAYNVGVGHVLDARRLAEKYGKEPDKWDENVDFFLLNKSLPKYYRDPVVEYGYCRGEEPFRFVTEILERYEHYLNITREAEDQIAEVAQ
ncbi:MAG TPA: transporter substrate-binding domain-containing protein [Bacteroidetes bacterium]|nr:transporter substrate-binding domain-containing protein [Bacteroidota bacterium]